MGRTYRRNAEEDFTIHTPPRGKDPAKIRMEEIDGYFWHVAYVAGKRHVLGVIGEVGHCLRP